MDDESFFLTMLLALALAILIGAGLSYNKNLKDKEFLKTNNCLLKEEVKTNKSVYCGKACFRKEIKKTYTCSFGEHIVLK